MNEAPLPSGEHKNELCSICRVVGRLEGVGDARREVPQVTFFLQNNEFLKQDR
jgi:hypothetical protein